MPTRTIIIPKRGKFEAFVPHGFSGTYGVRQQPMPTYHKPYVELTMRDRQQLGMKPSPKMTHAKQMLLEEAWRLWYLEYQQGRRITYENLAKTVGVGYVAVKRFMNYRRSQAGIKQINGAKKYTPEQVQQCYDLAKEIKMRHGKGSRYSLVEAGKRLGFSGRSIANGLELGWYTVKA